VAELEQNHNNLVYMLEHKLVHMWHHMDLPHVFRHLVMYPIACFCHTIEYLQSLEDFFFDEQF